MLDPVFLVQTGIHTASQAGGVSQTVCQRHNMKLCELNRTALLLVLYPVSLGTNVTYVKSLYRPFSAKCGYPDWLVNACWSLLAVAKEGVAQKYLVDSR